MHETPVEEFEEQFRLNLRPDLPRDGSGDPADADRHGRLRGHTRRIASVPRGRRVVASKAALLAFVRALDAEYRDDGIRVNAVLPSVIDTPANRASMPDADHESWVAPGEIAEVIHFLSSDASTPISGAEIPVYGRA